MKKFNMIKKVLPIPLTIILIAGIYVFNYGVGWCQESSFSSKDVKSIVVSQEKAKDYYKKGKKYYQQEDYARAKAAFSKVLEYNPDHRWAKMYIKRIDERISSYKRISSYAKETKAKTKREIKNWVAVDPSKKTLDEKSGFLAENVKTYNIDKEKLIKKERILRKQLEKEEKRLKNKLSKFEKDRRFQKIHSRDRLKFDTEKIQLIKQIERAKEAEAKEKRLKEEAEARLAKERFKKEREELDRRKKLEEKLRKEFEQKEKVLLSKLASLERRLKTQIESYEKQEQIFKSKEDTSLENSYIKAQKEIEEKIAKEQDRLQSQLKMFENMHKKRDALRRQKEEQLKKEAEKRFEQERQKRLEAEKRLLALQQKTNEYLRQELERYKQSERLSALNEAKDYYKKGITYYDDGDYDMALRQFEYAHLLNPEDKAYNEYIQRTQNALSKLKIETAKAEERAWQISSSEKAINKNNRETKVIVEKTVDSEPFSGMKEQIKKLKQKKLGLTEEIAGIKADISDYEKKIESKKRQLVEMKQDLQKKRALRKDKMDVLIKTEKERLEKLFNDKKRFLQQKREEILRDAEQKRLANEKDFRQSLLSLEKDIKLKEETLQDKNTISIIEKQGKITNLKDKIKTIKTDIEKIKQDIKSIQERHLFSNTTARDSIESYYSAYKQLYYNQKDYKNAIGKLEAILSIDPTDKNAYSLLVSCYDKIENDITEQMDKQIDIKRKEIEQRNEIEIKEGIKEIEADIVKKSKQLSEDREKNKLKAIDKLEQELNKKQQEAMSELASKKEIELLSLKESTQTVLTNILDRYKTEEKDIYKNFDMQIKEQTRLLEKDLAEKEEAVSKIKAERDELSLKLRLMKNYISKEEADKLSEQLIEKEIVLDSCSVKYQTAKDKKDEQLREIIKTIENNRKKELSALEKRRDIEVEKTQLRLEKNKMLFKSKIEKARKETLAKLKKDTQSRINSLMKIYTREEEEASIRLAQEKDNRINKLKEKLEKKKKKIITQLEKEKDDDISIWEQRLDMFQRRLEQAKKMYLDKQKTIDQKIAQLSASEMEKQKLVKDLKQSLSALEKELEREKINFDKKIKTIEKENKVQLNKTKELLRSELEDKNNILEEQTKKSLQEIIKKEMKAKNDKDKTYQSYKAEITAKEDVLQDKENEIINHTQEELNDLKLIFRKHKAALENAQKQLLMVIDDYTQKQKELIEAEKTVKEQKEKQRKLEEKLKQERIKQAKLEKKAMEKAEKEKREQLEEERKAKERARISKLSLMYKTGIKLYNNRQYEEAKAQFRELFNLEPDYKKVQSYINKTIAAIKKEKEKFENKKKKQEMLEIAEEQKAKKEELKSIYKSAIDLYKQKQYKQAEMKFKKLLSIEAGYKNVQKYINKCIVGMEKQKTNAEKQKRIKAEEKRKAKLKAMYDLAVELYKNKQYVQAKAKFEVLLVSGAGYKDAQKYISRCIAEVEKEKAMQKENIEKQKRQELKNKIKSFFEQGREFYKEKRYRDAIGEFEEVLALDSTNKSAARYIKRAKEQIEKQEQAKRAEIVRKKARERKEKEIKLSKEYKTELKQKQAKEKKLNEKIIQQEKELIVRRKKISADSSENEKWRKELEMLLAKRDAEWSKEVDKMNKWYKKQLEDQKKQEQKLDITIALEKRTLEAEKKMMKMKMEQERMLKEAQHRIELKQNKIADLKKKLSSLADVVKAEEEQINKLHKQEEEFKKIAEHPPWKKQGLTKEEKDRLKIKVIELVYNQAKADFKAGRYEQANIKFQKVIEWEGNPRILYTPYAKKYIERAKKKMKKEKEGKTQEEIEIELKEKEEQIASCIKDGKKYYKAEEYLDALYEFEIVLELEPDNDTAQEYVKKINKKLSTVKQKAHDIAKGEKEQAKKELEVRKKEIEREYKIKKEIKEKEKLSLKLKKEQELKMYYSQGKAYYKKGDYAKAILAFKKVLKEDPTHTLAAYSAKYIKRAENALGISLEDEVLESKNKEEVSSPAKEEIINRIGQKEKEILSRLKIKKGEEAEWQQVKEKDVENLIKQAKMHYKKGEFDKAVTKYKKALRENVEIEKVKLLLADAKEEQMKEQEKILRKQEEMDDTELMLQVAQKIRIDSDDDEDKENDFIPIVPLPKIRKQLQQKVSIDFADVALDYVFRYLSDATGVNIITSSGVNDSKKVSVRIKDMPLENALKYIVRNQGLEYRIEEKAVWVATAEEMEDEKIETRVYFLNQGPGLFAEFSASSVTSGKLGGGGELSEVTTIKDIIEEAIEFPKGGKIVLDERSGALIISNTPSNLQIIEDLLYNLDVTPIQVAIEARFIDITVTDLEQIGMDLQLDSNLKTNKGGGIEVASGSGINFSSLSRASSEGFNLTLAGVLTNPQYQIVLNALEENTRAKTLSAPKITSLNNQQASIEVVTEFMYPTRYEVSLIQFDSNGDGDFDDAGETEFANVPQDFVTRDIGIIFKVTPSVGADKKTITLALSPEVSTGVADVYTYSGNVSLPQFTSRNLNTSVVIKNGDTVVLGGLISETDSTTITKVPLLGSIPLVGKLFRNKSDSVERRNLLIFVTANIIE